MDSGGYRIIEERDGLAGRAAALSTLACTLGWLFSYPTREVAEEATSLQFVARCYALIEEASPGASSRLGDGFGRCASAAGDAPARAAGLRREHTRLFLVPFRPVSLEGSKWVRDRTLLARKKGERFAVEQEYRSMGVARKPGSSAPCDHLSCELDYVSLLAAAEARALEDGAMSLARELKQERERFMRDHLDDLALGVSSRVQQLSANPFLAFHARLLGAFIASCAGPPGR